jgi:hypothetical protein
MQVKTEDFSAPGRAATPQSIGFVVGIAGHLAQVIAVEREFGLPVVLIVLSQQMDDTVRRCDLRTRKIYSFPDFYEKQRRFVDELSLTSIRAIISNFEIRLGLGSVATLLRIERATPKDASYENMMRMTLLYLMFVEEILPHENFLWVKGNITTLFGLAFQFACVERCIPYLKQQGGRIDGRVEFMDETKNGMLRGWKSLFEALGRAENAVERDVVETADKWLTQFYNAPKRPSYADQYSRVNFSIQRVARRLYGSIAIRFDTQYWRAVFKYSFDRELGLRPRFGRPLLDDFLMPEWRRLWQYSARLFVSSVDLSEPYVYVPLQFHPEISTLTHAIRYEDQKHFVQELSKALPNGWLLYAKEHTSMVGRRSSSFYRDLAKLHNVVIVHPSVSTFDLMRNSKAVATLTSTAGWEAFLFGKPVIVFGNVFYEQCDGVLKANFEDNTADVIRTYVENFMADREVIKRAIVAYFGATYEGTAGDIGQDTMPSEAERSAAAFASAVRLQLARFPLSKLSVPPKSASALTSV